MLKVKLLLPVIMLCASAAAYDISETFVHTANASNIVLHTTLLDHPKLNDNPDAIFIVTQNWNPGNAAGVYNDHNFSVYYSGSKWRIYNEDLVNMPEGSSFNIIIPGDDVEVFQHVAEVANIIGQSTQIDNPLLNGNPDAVFQVTPNYNFSTYNNHPIGVWYNGTHWLIFNEDVATMPVNAAFFIMVTTNEDDKFVFTTNSGNTSLNYSTLDNPLVNSNQEAVIIETQNWNPSETGNIYNDHSIGLWYRNSASKWALFNQDISDMPLEASFNIYIPSSNVMTYRHTTTSENLNFNYTNLDNPMINGNPDVIIFATQNWSPTGTYNEHPVGVWYNSSVSKWAVFNQDEENMPLGASFNISIVRTDQTAFVHKAVTDNITGHTSLIDNPMLNNKPSAIFFVSQNWNPDASSSVYNNHPIGVYYFENNWRIFNEDFVDLAENASFNIVVPNDSLYSFMHEATLSNTTSNYTIIDDPKINNDSSAVLIVTQSWNQSVYNNHNIGVWYTGSRWSIFNQDQEDMPVGASFNVGILKGDGKEDPVVPVSTVNLKTSDNSEILNIYPNPFSENTKINIALKNGSRVELKIVDQIGRTIKTLENNMLTPGNYQYVFNAFGLAPGIYYCTLKSDSGLITSKIQIIK